MSLYLTLPFLLLIVVGCTVQEQPSNKKYIEVPGRSSSKILSHAVEVGNHLYLSGQLGFNNETNELAEGIEGQTHQTLKNIEAILKAANYTFADVVEVQVFIDDMDNYSKFNEIYIQYFPTNPPARAVVEVSRLPRDGKVEIKLSAIK